MNQQALRRTFILFHLTLSAVLFVQSVGAGAHAAGLSGAQPPNVALALFAAAEAVAALLFLLPVTMRWAGAALLIILTVALILHALAGQLHLVLLVYAAGVLFVMTHGSAIGKGQLSHKLLEQTDR